MAKVYSISDMYSCRNLSIFHRWKSFYAFKVSNAFWWHNFHSKTDEKSNFSCIKFKSLFRIFPWFCLNSTSMKKGELGIPEAKWKTFKIISSSFSFVYLFSHKLSSKEENIFYSFPIAFFLFIKDSSESFCIYSFIQFLYL